MLNFKNMSSKDKVLFAISPTSYFLAKTAEKAIDHLTEDSKSVQELKLEAQKKELYARIAESEARIAQEVAIAERIRTANTVEIEEFYEASGKGGLGVNATEGTISGSLGGEGRKITSRVYRFTGWGEAEKSFGQEIGEIEVTSTEED
jgi:hypothetical protein